MTKLVQPEYRLFRGGKMTKVKGHVKVQGGEVIWQGLGYEAAWKALRRMVDRRQIPFESCKDALDSGEYLIHPPDPALPRPPPWKPKTLTDDG